MNTPIRLPQSASVLTLFNPQRHTRAFLLLFSLGLGVGSFAVMRVGIPVWGATVSTLALIAYPAVQKWRDDLQRWGWPLTILAVLVALQGFHTVEHVAQWIEFHVLGWQPKESGGLISPLNAEVVHFVWNWSIVLIVGYLWRCRIRNVWIYPLFLWSLAHSLEHLYLFVQYIEYVQLLQNTGQSLSFAQGLPGILGSHGWLDTRGWDYPVTAFVSQWAPPSFFTAIRLDVHFWWNMPEFGLMLWYAHVAVRRQSKATGTWVSNVDTVAEASAVALA